MTPEDVIKQLDIIKKYADEDDDECAHSAEDSLYESVLGHIAEETCTDPKECARLALTSGSISFHRWCA